MALLLCLGHWTMLDPLDRPQIVVLGPSSRSQFLWLRTPAPWVSTGVGGRCHWIIWPPGGRRTTYWAKLAPAEPTSPGEKSMGERWKVRKINWNPRDCSYYCPQLLSIMFFFCQLNTPQKKKNVGKESLMPREKKIPTYFKHRVCSAYLLGHDFYSLTPAFSRVLLLWCRIILLWALQGPVSVFQMKLKPLLCPATPALWTCVSGHASRDPFTLLKIRTSKNFCLCRLFVAIFTM